MYLQANGIIVYKKFSFDIAKKDFKDSWEVIDDVSSIRSNWKHLGVIPLISLYSKMNETRIGFGLDRGLNLVFTQTQNRRVVHGIESVLNEFIKKGFIIGYEMEDPILRPGHYGRMLTEEMPLKFEGLDYEKGDCYTLLFHLQR